MNNSRADYLFSQYDLRETLERREIKMYGEIDRIDGNRLLNTTVDDLCDYFEQEYKIGPLKLHEDKITVDQYEAQIDVSEDPHRAIFDRSKPFYITATAVTFFIPFEGDQELFKCRPSSYTLNPPRAFINHNEIVLTYKRTDHNADAVKSVFERDLSEISSWVECINNDISPFNTSIRQKAKQKIEARREKLLKDQGLVASLGFPLKRHADAPKTFVVPTVRKKIPMPTPSQSTVPFVPEPTLDMQEYENILSVITNMVVVMERSPHAFRGMKEEDLRQHFLVQLNGQYEGQATGETFNFEGKTDILIRVNGKNIFIAECKFWRSPKSLMDAIDQLLNYVSWKDTKTAILIFNREKQFSEVLSKIPEIIKKHPNFKRELPCKSETGFKVILHHRDDTNRELILTVLAFEVPV